MSSVHNYMLVTLAYWALTLTDGALRMLVLLHFHTLGYSPLQLATLFLLYEFCGVLTNLFGGWLASIAGLRSTLRGGLALQVAALCMLALLADHWPQTLSVAYVVAAQALSGIAKDLTKMSAKSAIKLLVPKDATSTLFRWVALLTGSKNTLKGLGFFLGGVLLTSLGFHTSLWSMAGMLALIAFLSTTPLPKSMGRATTKPRASSLLSKRPEINRLSAARFFLFGSRDVWFVVAVPVFLSSTLHWSFTQVGTALALWVVGYGMVQAMAPRLLCPWIGKSTPGGKVATMLAVLLASSMAAIPLLLKTDIETSGVVLGGIALFGVVFALNSSVHSYLILAYSSEEDVSVNVGFYYMANAGGRLVGTFASGLLYQVGGLMACLWGSAVFALLSALLTLKLPRT